ncbi:MAG: sulfatase-like hydrolase/transferase [Gammaproteobacteria bacterium]|nr:sulfatase-like hydrolase/transferase [Gammaproteobacteria bacterium]
MPAQPNIVLLLSDQHAPSALGCAGHPFVRTPHLDALAARGVRFADTSCGNPLCVPSRMTFLTARHSSDYRGLDQRLPVAQQLGDVRPSPHHRRLRDHPLRPDALRRARSAARLRAADPGRCACPSGGIPRATCGQHADGVRPAGPGRTAYQVYDDAVFATAREFLAGWDAAPGTGPFFLTVGGVLPHCPFICPRPLFDEYFPLTDVPALPPDYLATLHPLPPALARECRAVDTLTEHEIRTARAAYYGLVTYL